jgi:hypothetical protein
MNKKLGGNTASPENNPHCNVVCGVYNYFIDASVQDLIFSSHSHERLGE